MNVEFEENGTTENYVARTGTAEYHITVFKSDGACIDSRAISIEHMEGREDKAEEKAVLAEFERWYGRY